MSFQFSFKLVIESFHLLQDFCFQSFQLLAVFFDGIRIAEALAETFTFFYISFVEDVAPEIFDFIRYIPAFVISYSFVDVV